MTVSVEPQLIIESALGYLLGRGLRLVVMKAFLEPLAAWAGQSSWRAADGALGGVLPDWFEPKENER